MSIKRTSLLPYFLASVLLLLVLFSLYVFYESRWLQQAFRQQVEVRGVALTETMERIATQAIRGNELIERLLSKRLQDNARLIDQLLLTHPPEPELIDQITKLNGLHRVDLLDLQGRPWPVAHLADLQAEMNDLFAGLQGAFGDVTVVVDPETILYVWGRKLWSPGAGTYSHPPRLEQSSFWEGTVFGVALGAQSFPGIIAVHADQEYVLNFQQEIGVQRQIEEFSRQSDIDYVALLDDSFRVVAHSDENVIGKTLRDEFMVRAQASRQPVSRIVSTEHKSRRYELVKPIAVNGLPRFLKIGLSMDSTDSAWQKSLWSKLILGVGILGLGVLGLAAIFYNQRSHMREIKALEAEVNRREHLSMMGNLAATVAHEVRNPLNSISMGLHRLKAEFKPKQDDAEYSHFIELMRGEVQRLNSIVEQFLSLARPLKLKPHDLKLEQLLSELTTLTESDAASSNVDIRLVAHRPSTVVTADPDYLKQVILNLILNSIQAMPEGGTLTLETSTSRGKVILRVRDSGVGIPKESLGRVFEPYFTTKANGSGLGLAIARRIIEEHGGTISVTSQPNKGSQFEIVLPQEGNFPKAAANDGTGPGHA